jgi:DNA-binding response OmpR family regulator
MNTPTRILTIEDDPHATRALRHVLTDELYELHVAHGDDVGLNLARDTPFDPVIIDLRWPGIYGLKLTLDSTDERTT